MNHKLDTDTHVFFYEQEFYVLSNFSAFQILWKSDDTHSLWHSTSEHLYHFLKFWYPERDSNQTNIAHRIYASKSAHGAFQIAQKHKLDRRPDWDDVKVGIMRDILRAKVQQHPYVKKKLLETGDRILVEDSWRDDVWGWGPNKDGQNLLGKLWMEIRDEIRNDVAAN